MEPLTQPEQLSPADRDALEGDPLASRALTENRELAALAPEAEPLPDLADASATEPLGLDTAAALARLPQSQQELLSLFYIDGLNLSETGQVLGIRPQVVRQRLYRARQALRRQLESTPATQRARRPAGGDCHETR